MHVLFHVLSDLISVIGSLHYKSTNKYIYHISFQTQPTENPIIASPISSTPTSSPVQGVTPCEDDTSWHGKFNVAHTCDFVGEMPATRCNFESTDGTKALVACKKSCDQCDSTALNPTVSPVTVSPTVSSVTQSPTLTRVTARPTSSPVASDPTSTPTFRVGYA